MSMDFDSDGNLVFKDDIEKKEEIIEKEKKLDLFKDILSNILTSKQLLDWEDVKKSYSSFVINRCLVNIDKYVLFIAKLNRLSSKIPPNIHYKLTHNQIDPKKKIFTGYLRTGTYEKDITTIATFFDTNEEIIAMKISLLEDSQIKNIVKKIKKIEIENSK